MISWAFSLEFIFGIYCKGYQSRLIYMNIWYATINILDGKKIRFLKIQIMKDIFKEIMNVFGYPMSSMFLMKESRCCGRLNNSSPKDIHALNPGNYEHHSIWQKRDFAKIKDLGLSWVIQVISKCNHRHPCKETEGDLTTEERQYDLGGRDQSDAATKRGMPAATKSWKRQETHLP